MKITTTLVTSILLFSSISCFATGQGVAQKVKEQSVEMECPSKIFKDFLEAFSESTALQKAFTELPGVDNDETTFPMIFPAEKRSKEHMNLKIEHVTGKTAKVIYDKDETDYKIAFYFEKKQCWTLVRVEDLSG